MEHTLK